MTSKIGSLLSAVQGNAGFVDDSAASSPEVVNLVLQKVVQKEMRYVQQVMNQIMLSVIAGIGNSGISNSGVSNSNNINNPTGWMSNNALGMPDSNGPAGWLGNDPLSPLNDPLSPLINDPLSPLAPSALDSGIF